MTRLRKECPNAECGAGTFMANHFDRHYCGKCGLTYVYQKAQGGHTFRRSDNGERGQSGVAAMGLLLRVQACDKSSGERHGGRGIASAAPQTAVSIPCD
ncbi:Ubiquitin-40S ribosomal protein S27a [Platanthera guangdongensis]|uniref:Ubiquitin-40S ribosomal protein S27a n=1 Tax=Platanthera guangdongensis TaxID=2320717 RepID=A0ABR2MR03_9ASPA